MQVFNVCTSPVVQSAWDEGQDLAIHGLVYSLEDGLLKVRSGYRLPCRVTACPHPRSALVRPAPPPDLVCPPPLPTHTHPRRS